MATRELITEETIEETSITTKTTIRTIEDVIMPPELVIIDKQVYCTSLQIAKHFEKRHDNVLQDITNAILQVQAANTPDMQVEQMFQKGFDEDTNNLGFKVKRPMVHLNRDGFTFLVMSYNGAKAAKFKLAYMSAFNKMEQLLKNLPAPLEPEVATISAEQVAWLEYKIGLIADRFHMEHASHWLRNMLRFHCNVDKLKEIKAEDFSKAQALMEHAEQQGQACFKFRLELEEDILKNYLCQGIPFTTGLRKKFIQQFKSKLPVPLDWKAITLRLELDSNLLTN